MHFRTTVFALACIIAAALAPLATLAAPAGQNADPKSLTLVLADLPTGFVIGGDKFEPGRADGFTLYDITFTRAPTAQALQSGPVEVRSGAARAPSADDAARQLPAVRQAYLDSQYTESSVPPLGDEWLGLSQTTDGEGGKTVEHVYLFRKSNWLMLISLRGRADVVTMNDAIGFALKMSRKVDGAIGAAPAAAPAGPTATAAPGAPPAGPAPAPSSSGEKAKVVNADGGTANMRAEPSTTATVVAQVAEGTIVDIVGADRTADGRTWRNVRTDGKTGWIASTLLEPVPGAPAPSPTQPPAPTTAGLAPTATPAAPAATPTPQPAAGPPVVTAQGQGGHAVEIQLKETSLSSGEQVVKVRVTRNGGPVADAKVYITFRLSPERYLGKVADPTNGDGRSELAWDVDGPPGEYEVLVEIRLREDSPVVVSGSSRFRWQT
jgi:hypothetical protein